MSSECSGVKIIVPPNPEKMIEAKKRELAIQARNAKKNVEHDPAKNRTDIKKKDHKAEKITQKYSAGNIAGSLVKNPAGAIINKK